MIYKISQSSRYSEIDYFVVADGDENGGHSHGEDFASLCTNEH